LRCRTGEAQYRARATRLIDDVHHHLGRHRPDDPRSGWLSGLSEDEGARHPTRGGLRIGKRLPDRDPDERLEWDRDGQYFHYLTKWMDALSRAASILEEPEYLRHARELAKSVFPRFLQRSPSGAPLGLAWKMSVDLSRAQVPGLNPHDALDGYITFRQLGRNEASSELEREIDILRSLSLDNRWETSDPLGIGGLLLDAFRLAMLPDQEPVDEHIAGDVLSGAQTGLQHFLISGTLEMPPSRRLAFRELGLAIGLQTMSSIAAVENSASLLGPDPSQMLSREAGEDIGDQLVEFWYRLQRQSEPLWLEHADINDVMLATALLRAQIGTA